MYQEILLGLWGDTGALWNHSLVLSSTFAYDLHVGEIRRAEGKPMTGVVEDGQTNQAGLLHGLGQPCQLHATFGRFGRTVTL